MSMDGKYALIAGVLAGLVGLLLLYLFSDILSLSHLEEVIKTAH